MKEQSSKTRMLQVSLEGLDLDEAQMHRLETTMKSAVLTELARFDLPHGIAFEQIGKGRVVGGHIINGIILRDLSRIIKDLQPSR